MGMAASQARLLSITARLSNNENTGQSISYSKQRLADQTQQITNEYNEALDATKLTVLTGFNGAQANYEDISYKLMTGKQMALNTRQYVVTDTKGKVLLDSETAKAYERSKGQFNVFLAQFGLSQADIGVQVSDEKRQYYDIYGNKVKEDDENAVGYYDTNPATVAAMQQIHEAWDKYFDTVGITKFMPEHDLGISWTETYALGSNGNNNDDYSIGDGYAGFAKFATNEDGSIKYEQKFDEEGNLVDDLDKPKYKRDANNKIIYYPISYEGSSKESRELYDYAMALTEAYLRVPGEANNGVEMKKAFDLSDMKTPANYPDANSEIRYYRNIFDKIQSNGYFTYTNTPAQIDENHLYVLEGTGTKGTVKKNPLEDNYTFEAGLRDGSLRLEYFSTTEKTFKSTTLSEDNCIQEVADERAIARAESKYNQDMADLENKDKKLDLELKKLDTEHNALQTEYEAVKNVVDKNVESSFKIFS